MVNHLFLVTWPLMYSSYTSSSRRTFVYRRNNGNSFTISPLHIHKSTFPMPAKISSCSHLFKYFYILQARWHCTVGTFHSSYQKKSFAVTNRWLNAECNNENQWNFCILNELVFFLLYFITTLHASNGICLYPQLKNKLYGLVPNK